MIRIVILSSLTAFVIIYVSYVITKDSYYFDITNIKQSKKSQISVTRMAIGKNGTHSVNRNTCNPIIKDAIQPSVVIDNVTYPKRIPMFLNKSLNFTCLNENRTPKVILYWNQKYASSDFHYGIGKDELFRNMRCPVTNCEMTNNRSRLNESSLILFSIWDPVDVLPQYRTPDQRWIFVLIESQQRFIYFHKLGNFNNLFNLSATHRLDSDFVSFYTGYFQHTWERDIYFDPNKNFMGNKTQMAFQVSTNCGSMGKREVYINELNKYINVRVYGKCGTPCTTIVPADNWLDEECKIALVPHYKFYLAFENSICKDYITEKFFSILNYDIIPVVYGDGPYEEYIPKSGFINAFDFESPKDLAEYMHKVASNVTLYNSYFKWKQHSRYISYPVHNPMCEMCIQLNLDQHLGIRHSVIKNMTDFWNRKKECKNLNTTTFKLQPLPF